MSRLRGMFDPSPGNAERGQRFAGRRAEWRRREARFYARHAEVERYAPALMSAMFDRAVREVGPGRVYGLRADTLGETVRLNAGNWLWYTASGTAEGRGLYEMWAWRFDIPVARAAEEIWGSIWASAEAPRLRRAA